MKKAEFVKAFTCFSRQKYYDTIRHYEKGIADCVMFGNYAADKMGCEYELSMDWIHLNNKELATPQLCIFNDAFKALEEHAELFKQLALLHRRYFSPDEFCRLLLRLGYNDFSDEKLGDGSLD